MAPIEVTCPECGEGVYEESDFCPHCGVLREPVDPPPCGVHPDRRAEHVCIICHRPLCPRCRKRNQGKSFCGDHQKVEVVLDWACVFKANDPAETELVRSLLMSGGFTVMRQNLDSGGVWGTALVRPSTVFVPIPEYLDAREALAELLSANWACVFKAKDSAEAELARSLLESGGFTVMRQNLDSRGVSGTELVGSSTVFVPIPEYLDAKEALAEWLRAKEIGGENGYLPRGRREIRPDDER